MKPNSIAVSLNDGRISLGVNRPTKVEDLVWDAVQEAIAAGWTPTQFKNESASAWSQALRDLSKDAETEWAK